MRAFLDTNVLVRHLTGDPPDTATRATSFLAQGNDLLLLDLVLAEVVYVLESFYRVPRTRVAQLARSIVTFESISVVDEALVLRAVELYEVQRLDFAVAYLVASAERAGSVPVASFDRVIDRVGTIARVER